MIIAALFALAACAQGDFLLKTAGNDLSGVLSRHGLVLSRTLRGGNPGLYEVRSVQNISPAQLIADVSADKAVVSFEADSEVPETEAPSPSTPIQPSIAALNWALQNKSTTNYFGSVVRSVYVDQPATGLIGLLSALSAFGSGSTVVAVIDTGVDPTHPALKKVLVSGYDFTRDVPGIPSELADLNQSTVAILDQSTVAILDHKNTPAILNQSTVAILDQSTVAVLDGVKLPAAFGHGTMTAGLVHLVAPSARIMPLKAFKADGSANLSDIIRAVYYAVDHGAHVINMSFSMTAPSLELSAAIAYAVKHKVICIASAGNEGREARVYPAGIAGVFGVASTSNSDIRSAFSNYGDGCARTAAPGEALITTYPGNNYAGVWGTSFSAALTSGGVALFEQLFPNLSPGRVSDALDSGHQLVGQDCGRRLDLIASLFSLLHP